jgi:ferric-dicitrate binding protein FerR (iron transport regulator)
MAVTSHSIPADLVAGVRAGDDTVIERGFHDLYPTLVAEAEADLHDKASSARVVERAFLHVMSGDPPADAQEFDRALSQAIHQSVVREQSRLAALRRFEHNEGVGAHASHAGAAAADATQAWEHIKEARARVAAGHAPVDSAQARHAAASHMAAAGGRDNKKWFIPLLIGVLIIGAAGYGVTRMDLRPSEKFVIAQLNSTQAKTIGTRPGQVGNISLADGSLLKIAAGSQLKLNNNFNEKLRAVLVNGAASFTVAPDKKPLEIRGKEFAISTTEGKVDIRADDNRQALVRVVAGNPRITVGDSSWTAAAGQTFVVNKGAIRTASAAELDEAFAWLQGRFFVTGTVRDVVEGIRRWYDMDVGIGDNSIADWPASATGTLESLNPTIASLEKSAKVKMVWQNRQMLLFRK